mmetsp:Transcript_41299/g.116912  ORF Transcript_41299/g.116912 Transcript_41299/m.116912 type:complete len:203 (+) Transcript_41299:352-960(+)
MPAQVSCSRAASRHGQPCREACTPTPKKVREFGTPCAPSPARRTLDPPPRSVLRLSRSPPARAGGRPPGRPRAACALAPPPAPSWAAPGPEAPGGAGRRPRVDRQEWPELPPRAARAPDPGLGGGPAPAAEWLTLAFRHTRPRPAGGRRGPAVHDWRGHRGGAPEPAARSPEVRSPPAELHTRSSPPGPAPSPTRGERTSLI